MLGKRFAAVGTCAVLAVGALSGATGLMAQAAVGDASYTAAVNRAILMGDVFDDTLFAEHDLASTLASELTGKQLQSMSDAALDDDWYETFTHNYTYVFDTSGVQAATTDLYGSEESFPVQGPINCGITFDSAGYPSAVAVEEPTDYDVFYTWYNQIYQTTYDGAGRPCSVTRYVIRSAGNPYPIEESTPFSTTSITYDEAGRISVITKHVNALDFVYDDTTCTKSLEVTETYEDAYEYTYDDKNRVTAIDYSSVSGEGEISSSHNEYSYNRYGEVLTHTRIDSSDPTVLAANDRYSYRQDGTLTKCTDYVDTSHVITYNYQ